MPRPRSALTQFILSLPADLPVADVIAQAKAAGMETSEQNVSRVRKMASGKSAKKPTKPAATKTPPTTTAEAPPSSGSGSMSGSDFVRNQPLDLTPGVVVAMAKAQGITISDSLVRKVRGPQGKTPKASAAKKTPSVKKTPGKKTQATAKVPSSKPPTISKSDFIRQQPATMSVADVIAKGKAEGIEIGDTLVYKARGRSSAQKSGAKKVTPKKAAAATQRTGAKSSSPKSDFIRQQPSTMSAKEVVAKGKAAGLTFTDALVYMVRGKQKGTAKKAAPKKTQAAPRPTASPKSDFIRQQPTSMSIPEVVAAGKKAGLTFSRALVHIVRAKMTGKGITKKPVGKTTPAASRKTPMTKADFVRANPSLTPKQIVAKAVADGMTFTENYVSNVRTYDKAVAARKKATTATKAATTKTPAQPPTALSKADFVRQHPDLSPKDIVKMARAEGLKFDEHYVYNVRAKDKTAGKKLTAKKVAPKTTPSKAPATLSKADFVRQHPSLSAKDVVEKAKAAGMKLDTNHVYTVRTYDKRAKTKKRAAKKLASKSAITTAVVEPVTVVKTFVAPKPEAVPTPARPSAAEDDRIEDLLRAAASALGFGRALEVIQAEQARIRAMLGA